MSKKYNSINEKQIEKNVSSIWKKFKKIVFSIIWITFFFRILFTDIGLLINHEFIKIDDCKFIFIRFLFYILIIVLSWILIGNKRFWKNIGLLIIFPIYPVSTNIIKYIILDIPAFLLKYKYNYLLINYIDSILYYFFNLKEILAIQITGLLALILLFWLEGYWLIIPIILLSFMMIYHLKKRYTQTFEPIRLFQVNIEKILKMEGEIFNKEKFNDVIEGKQDIVNQNNTIVNNEEFSESSDSELEVKYADKNECTDRNAEANIITNAEEHKTNDKRKESVLLIIELINVLKSKIENVLKSRSYMKSFIWKALYSFLFSMIIFSGINFAVYTINPYNYKSEFNLNFFDFFYYSFFTIFPDGTDIEPVTILAKFIRMIGVLVGVFINLVILAVYFTISSERHKANLEAVFKTLDDYSNGTNNYFYEKYGQSATSLIKVLLNNSKDFKEIVSFLKDFLK
jgi:hypothetical protein